jgi:hypothetical protein
LSNYPLQAYHFIVAAHDENGLLNWFLVIKDDFSKVKNGN